MIPVERGALPVPLGQELVLARLRPARPPPGSSPTLAILLLELLQHGPQMRVRLATGSDVTRASGVWLATGIRR
jgi:hypothetical protein